MPLSTSLTHDSIIVQIPRLQGKANNRLDEILSIFDQSHVNATSQHMLDLDDSLYDDDDVEASVKMSHKTGMSPENIAASLNMPIETVRKILS